MPIYEYQCLDCNATSEIVLVASDDEPQCSACGGKNLERLLSAHSSISGSGAGQTKSGLPGLGDTGCCGSTPGHAGCAGPGSCCGKA